MTRLLSAGLLLALAACAAPMAKPKVQVYQAHPPTLAIEIFQTKSPDRPYKEIGRIDVGDTDDAYCMDQIIREGKKMGADGVIIVGRSGSQAAAVPIGNMIYATSGDYGLVAVAIKFASSP